MLNSAPDRFKHVGKFQFLVIFKNMGNGMTQYSLTRFLPYLYQIKMLDVHVVVVGLILIKTCQNMSKHVENASKLVTISIEMMHWIGGPC